MPVDKPKPGESREDYLAYCIPAEIKEGYDSDQAAAICYQKFETQLIEDNRKLLNFLPSLETMANDPSSSNTFRGFIQYLKSIA